MTHCHHAFAKRAYNKPYEIKGRVYVPQHFYEYSEQGTASYYGGRDIFHGRPTSNGERFNKNAITAAHKTLPIPCVVRVTNLDNQRSLMVKVNDRGPFIPGRIIDVSEKVAKLLGFHRKGTSRVHVETDVPGSLQLAQAMALRKNPKRPRLMLAKGTAKGKRGSLQKPQKSPLQARQFTLDLGGFYDKNRAMHYARYLRQRGPVGIQTTKTSSGKPLYRVVAGPFQSAVQAKRVLKKMHTQNIRATLRTS